MYNDMYETFDDCQFEYSYPISFHAGNRDYLLPDQIPSFDWAYGNTVDLHFILYDICKVKKSDIPKVEERLKQYSAEVKFYNFRHEEIYTMKYVATPQLKVEIDRDTSEKIFKKGTYFVSVKLFNEARNDVRTIHSDGEMLIYVY